jgi:RHS repeat-associated protein
VRFACKFTGKERDQESGLDYFGARYYGSSMGRFMSPDPSGLSYADPTNPQSLNLYSYVLNNPLKFTDPTCMRVVKPGLSVIRIAGDFSHPGMVGFYARARVGGAATDGGTHPIVNLFVKAS